MLSHPLVPHFAFGCQVHSRRPPDVSSSEQYHDQNMAVFLLADRIGRRLEIRVHRDDDDDACEWSRERQLGGDPISTPWRQHDNGMQHRSRRLSHKRGIRTGKKASLTMPSMQRTTASNAGPGQLKNGCLKKANPMRPSCGLGFLGINSTAARSSSQHSRHLSTCGAKATCNGFF